MSLFRSINACSAGRSRPHANQAAHYDVANSAGKLISSIHELPTEFRGEQEYWAIQFAVDDLAAARETVIGAGGDFKSMQDGTAFVVTLTTLPSFSLTQLERPASSDPNRYSTAWHRIATLRAPISPSTSGARLSRTAAAKSSISAL